ncbi:MAG: hypothetical protein K2W96_07830 [Gemmataceae bacterium]|nr:hypothetical protein [Gemmataceae bacterium]
MCAAADRVHCQAAAWDAEGAGPMARKKPRDSCKLLPRGHVIADRAVNFVERQALFGNAWVERMIRGYTIDLLLLTHRESGEVDEENMRFAPTMHATYAALKKIMADLGFTMTADSQEIRFDHKESKTWFLFKPGKDDDPVDPIHLAGTRRILDARGLLDEKEFERLVGYRAAG